MVNQELLTSVRHMPAADRWELATALWASIEDDFPVTPETRALLTDRAAEPMPQPGAARTWQEIKTNWHAANG